MTYFTLPKTSSTISSNASPSQTVSSRQSTQSWRSLNVFQGIRQRLNQFKVNNPHVAHWLCRTIPMQCPFEQDIVVLGHTVAHIPPLCKLNPFYEEVVGLRFRALCYLADECGEDVQQYC
ncbi:MAG: Mo-dependent nitrogenase C-terminal domain-containing protein [Elainellaceae cyanobacterium]